MISQERTSTASHPPFACLFLLFPRIILPLLQRGPRLRLATSLFCPFLLLAICLPADKAGKRGRHSSTNFNISPFEHKTLKLAIYTRYIRINGPKHFNIFQPGRALIFFSDLTLNRIEPRRMLFTNVSRSCSVFQIALRYLSVNWQENFFHFFFYLPPRISSWKSSSLERK